MTPDSTQHDKIRERFTETADIFARNTRRLRTEEAERLAERATAGLANADKLLAIDLACGPGTYTRPLAARVHRAIGADLTPAMVEKARAEAARDGITNIEFVCADIYAPPFADSVAGSDLAGLFKEGFDVLRDEVIETTPDWKQDHARVRRFVARKR